MKTELAIALSDHVREHKDSFRNRPGTLNEMAAAVSKDVGFTVKPSQLRDVLRANGIETRRIPEQQRQRLALLEANERLEAENRTIKTVLAKVAASEHIPEELKDYILATLPQEIKDALRPCPTA